MHNNLNGSYIGEEFDHDARTGKLMAIFDEGVAFTASLGDNVVFANTFVSNDLLFPNQKQLAELARKKSYRGKYPVLIVQKDEDSELQIFGEPDFGKPYYSL